MKISARKGNAKAKAKGKVSVSGPAGSTKGKKKWCNGNIWFTDDGCIYIADKSLADAVLRNYLETGKLCVTVEDEFSPSYEVNILCKC
jgi:hypothetical protein